MSPNSVCLIFGLYLFPLVHSLDNKTTESVDTCLQDFAFKSLVRHRPHTGALYKAMLPANLSGMTVSIVRLRSRRLWNRGANFSNFHIPSRTMPVPYVKRLALVYQDLGNWSSHYYTVPGYSMITPVIGFEVFDASNVRAKSTTTLSLNTVGKSIVIGFPNLMLSESMVSRGRCATFSRNGTLHLSQMSVPNVCLSQDLGHFSIVVPLKKKKNVIPLKKKKKKKKQGLWNLWVIGIVLGFFGLILLGYAGIASLKVVKAKKIQVLERQADEDLVLGTISVGRSKMPSATVTRTQPMLEDGGFP